MKPGCGIRPRPLKHGKPPLRELRPISRPARKEACSSMTICIGAICQWNYGTLEKPEWGNAVVTAADRMLTDSGLEIQFEGSGKFAPCGNRAIILVADSMPVQSELVFRLHKAIEGKPNITAREVADNYADLLIRYKRDDAEKLYLAPYGLTMESFPEIIRTSETSLITDLAQRVLHHAVAAEAIIAGVNEQGHPSLYHVDSDGIITSHVDVGFVSIGSGHYHSNAWLMAHGYHNKWRLYDAIVAISVAKAQAENAPGVGKSTDFHLITAGGLSPVGSELVDAITAEFPNYRKRVGRLEASLRDKIWKRAGKAIEKNQTAALPTEPIKDPIKPA